MEEDDTVRVELTKGKWALIDRDDVDIIIRYNYYARCQGQTYYAERSVHIPGARRHYMSSMHVDIMGPAPEGKEWDHRDGDGLNNRRSNLRLATRSQQLMNAHKEKPTASGYRGVAMNTAGWMARLNANKKAYYGGTYATEVEAARAYDRLAKEHHGTFAILNFPDDKDV